MAIEHVQGRWSQYQLLVKIEYNALNGKINLEGGTIPPFPNRVSKWGDWVMGVAFRLSLDEQIETTDAALKSALKALKTNHTIAAAISVNAPDKDTVDKLVKGLEELNEVIKADNRFHAALAIGVALAGEVERRKALPP